MRAAKQAIRAEVGAALKLVSPTERAQATGRAFAQLERTTTWRRARRVLIYAPLPTEPDLDQWWTFGAERRGQREMCYPRIVGRELEVRLVRAPLQLRPTAFGLREPDPDRTEVVDPASLGLVIVPGVAFTRGGDRLGRGAGFYDLFLASLPPHVATAAFLFNCQVRDVLPVEPHDRRVQRLCIG